MWRCLAFYDSVLEVEIWYWERSIPATVSGAFCVSIVGIWAAVGCDSCDKTGDGFGIFWIVL